MGVEKMRFGNNKQYIELRDGNNYPLIAGMCFVLILLVALFTSKLWLPDNRYVMKFEPESEMMFSLASVTLPKEVYFDESKDLLEFDMKQMSMSKDKSFSLKMSVFSINQIYESIWNEEAIGADNTVAVHIRHIREKIEINPKDPRYLKVVWGVGYKIEKA